MEDLAAFTNDLHGYLMSNGAVKPRIGGSTTTQTGRSTAAPARTGTAPSEPVRTPTTAK